MKTLPLLSLACFAIATPLVASDKLTSILTFADETIITGQPLSVQADQKTLKLNSPSLQGETLLKTNQLLEMALNGKPKTIESDHYALATIKPHHKDPHMDTLRGRLVHLDEETITLDTWYAGRLTLKRSLVHALDIFKQSPTFYSGPNGPEGWVTSDGDLEDNWTFKNRAMTSKSRRGAARKIQVPERAKIHASVSWKGSPYFRILLFSENPNSDYPDTGYNLNVQTTRLTLYRSEPGQQSKDVFNERIESIREVDEIDVTIYLDRTKDGANAVYLDGKKIGEWTDVDDTILTGEWLHFVPGQRNTPLRISNISVSQWDGTLPASSDGEEVPKEDDGLGLTGQEVRLANGDVITGSIQKIDKNLVLLTTDFGDVNVPLRRLKSISLDDKEDEDRMEINDVRAWFHRGGYVTIKMKSFDGKTIKGYSQVYGDAEFDINAFARIQFNIWDRKLDPARLGNNLDW